MTNLTNNVKARVLNAVSAIDPIVTNASNRTSNYELPLFIGSDKPAWLVDWNNTMVALDTLMKEVESTGTDNTTVIGQIQTKLADLEKVVQTAQSDITANSNNITENANNIKELTNSLNTVQDDLISQNSVIKTHTTQIADLQSVNETHTTQIAELQSVDETQNTNIESAEGKATTAIGLANEGINKANTAQETADSAQSTFNEYVREHSNYQYTPLTNIVCVKVPGVMQEDVDLTIPRKNITGSTQGKEESFGILIAEYISSTSPNKHVPQSDSSCIIPFVVDNSGDPYFINNDGEKVKNTQQISFGNPAFIFNISTISYQGNDVVFRVGSQSTSTGSGYNAIVKGILL